VEFQQGSQVAQANVIWAIRCSQRLLQTLNPVNMTQLNHLNARSTSYPVIRVMPNLFALGSAVTPPHRCELRVHTFYFIFLYLFGSSDELTVELN
jgi:hypothetical protein